jgi:hypothetical protein
LQQSYLHALSQPKLDVSATTIALTRLADRLTDKKANTQNLGKAQQELTEDQLRQLAKNFKSFRSLRHSLDVAIHRVLADGVTNKAEKRYLTLLRTIATNIDATEEMIQSLSAAKGFDADLTADPPQNAKLPSLRSAILRAWDEVKAGNKQSAGALIQAAIEQPPSTRRSSREVSIRAQRDSVRHQWEVFKKRGTFDSSQTWTLLEAALRRQGGKERSLCRETAERAVSTVSNLATPSEQAELLLPLLQAIFDQLDGKTAANEMLTTAVQSILERCPKEAVFSEDFEEEDIPNPYRPENKQILPNPSAVSKSIPTSSAASTPIRHLWEEHDPKKLRYAIHDLSRKLRDKHRQFSESPDRWTRQVKGDLVRQGFTPDHVEAILSVVDSEAFGEKLEGHGGLLVSVFRQIASESETIGKRFAGALKIQNDADVYGNVLVKSIDWLITETALDPDFDPYDEIEQLLKEENFESNFEICCFFQRHRWLEECLTIPDDAEEDFFRPAEDVKNMQKVKDLLRDLAGPLEAISNPLSAISRQMIGFDPDVTPFDTRMQVERLLRIYKEYEERREADDPDLTPIQALGIYFQTYGRGTESLVEQAAQLPRLPSQPAPARSHADSEWQKQSDAIEDLATVVSTLRQTPSS